MRIPLRELSIPRRTLMVCREQGYLSDSARELIKIVKSFDWGNRADRAASLTDDRLRAARSPASVTRLARPSAQR